MCMWLLFCLLHDPACTARHEADVAITTWQAAVTGRFKAGLILSRRDHTEVGRTLGMMAGDVEKGIPRISVPAYI